MYRGDTRWAYGKGKRRGEGGEGLLDFVGAYRLVTVGGMTEPGAYLAASQPPTPQNLVIVHSRCIVRVHSRCIVVGTRSLPLHSVAWVPALQLWPTILMMATTQVQIYPPPLTPSRSVSRSYLSLPPPLSFLSFSLCQPLALVARFSADTSPRYAALRRHDTSAFADPTTLSAFSTRPQPSHSRFIQRYPPSSVRPFGFVHLSDHVFASVSRLTHFTTHFARCKTMMNTDDRTGTWHRDTQTKPTGRGSSLTRFVLSGFSSYRENRESCLHPFENSFEEIEEDPKNHFLRNVNQQSSYSSKFNSPLS